ncbi:LuxR C-terminal-related transcriptional regulator [Microbacterium sp. JZ101]
MQHLLGAPDPTRIAEAFESGDLATIEDLSDELWYRFPAEYGPQIARVAARLSPAELEQHPRLLLAAFQAHQFGRRGDNEAQRGFLQVYVTRGRRYALRYATFPKPADLLAAGVIAMIGARLRGDYAEAERIGSDIADRLAEMPEPEPLPWLDAGGRRPGWLSMQRSLTAMLSGRYEDALTHARTSFEQMGPPPSRHYAGVNAAATAALLSALAGSHRSATRWLEEVRQSGTPDMLMQDLVMAPAHLATALLSMDALSERAARRSLRRLGDPHAPYEVWPFIAAAWARYGNLFGSPFAALAQLEDVIEAHGAKSQQARIAGGLLLRLRADLLLAAGDGAAVIGLAADHPSQEMLRIPLARAHLRAGELGTAIRLSSPPLRWTTTTRRDTLDHLLILAAAQLRRGEETDAGALFLRAHEYLIATGNRSAFREMNPDDLQALCALTKIESPLGAHTVPAARHAEVHLPRLTPRELIVLRALSTSDTLGGIAARLNVSLNTVRSQARSVYRKLGVSRREDAVAAALRMGLLGGEAPQRTS